MGRKKEPSGAAWIVTEDKDLLELGKYGEIKIVTPKDFFERVAR